MLRFKAPRILATIKGSLDGAICVIILVHIAMVALHTSIAGDQASPEDVERIREALGLNQKFPVRFGGWLWHVLQGDLGTSIFTNLPVARMIAQRIEPTLSLMVVTLLLAVTVAVPIGVVAAWK